VANYGFNDLIVTIDDSAGDAQVMSAYVYEVSAFSIEAILEDSHTAGDAWVEKLFTGLKAGGEFSISGAYDDTASVGPRVILDSIGSTRTFLFTWDGVTGARTSGFDCIIKKWDRTPGRGALTKFTATLQPTGAVAENA
jgi:hypothetical protein